MYGLTVGKCPISPWIALAGLLLTAGLVQAAPPACGTQFQYSCSSATLGGYTVITPLAATGQTQIVGYNASSAVVFNQTLPIPPSGTAASDNPTQQAVLQADALVAAQSGLASTLPACGSPPCLATNPGGPSVTTNSTTSSYVTQDTPVSARVDQYSTTLSAVLNGTATVFQQTYAMAFSDPTVQAAVSTADAILTGDHATPSAPVQTSTSTALQGTQLSYVLTGDTTPTGNVTVTSTKTFGPAPILVNQNQTDDFLVLAGQVDTNVNTNTEYYAARNDVTTSTYLTTSAYTISGTASVSATPAPASWMLLLTGLGVAGLLAWLRRLRDAA